jgi:hypothetical protein
LKAAQKDLGIASAEPAARVSPTSTDTAEPRASRPWWRRVFGQ